MKHHNCDGQSSYQSHGDNRPQHFLNLKVNTIATMHEATDILSFRITIFMLYWFHGHYSTTIQFGLGYH